MLAHVLTVFSALPTASAICFVVMVFTPKKENPLTPVEVGYKGYDLKIAH
jgi:hypothetical protein